MKQYPLIGISIIGVIILILASLSNVAGYQAVQSSNQQNLKKEVNQRELLFQTIIDIVNNKEIQRIILKSQMSRGMFPVLDIPVIKKNQLKQMYFIGLILSKVLSKSRMHSIIRTVQFNNQEMQKEISAVIENDATLQREITQFLNFRCDCDNEKTSSWDFLILCTILQGIGTVGFFMTIFGPFPTIGMYMVGICLSIGVLFDCYWLNDSQYTIVG